MPTQITLTKINLPAASFWFTFERKDGTRFHVETTQKEYELNRLKGAIFPIQPDCIFVGGHEGIYISPGSYADDGSRYIVNISRGIFGIPYSEISKGVFTPSSDTINKYQKTWL